MISFLSSWTKSVALSIIIVSILEMLLPNNKTKKYIKMVMGTYVLFCMISPFVQNKVKFDLNEYVEASTVKVDQTSMNKRIEELYIEQLEKDIKTKVQEKGYKVNRCKVKVTIADNVEETKIDKITLQVGGEITSSQKNELKNFLVQEYEVKERCLTIN